MILASSDARIRVCWVPEKKVLVGRAGWDLRGRYGQPINRSTLGTQQNSLMGCLFIHDKTRDSHYCFNLTEQLKAQKKFNSVM